jgi:hypothetical protein
VLDCTVPLVKMELCSETADQTKVQCDMAERIEGRGFFKAEYSSQPRWMTVNVCLRRCKCNTDICVDDRMGHLMDSSG